MNQENGYGDPCLRATSQNLEGRKPASPLRRRTSRSTLLPLSAPACVPIAGPCRYYMSPNARNGRSSPATRLENEACRPPSPAPPALAQADQLHLFVISECIARVEVLDDRKQSAAAVYGGTMMDTNQGPRPCCDTERRSTMSRSW